MTNENNSQKLTPTQNNISIPKNNRVGITGLHARIAAPQASNNIDVAMLPNRLALLLDVSGSMSGKKIESLRNAMSSFIDNISFADTAVALRTFGGEDSELTQPLTTFHPILMTSIMTLRARGGTPMANAMRYALESWPITRFVLVSDGEPDNDTAAFTVAFEMQSAETSCDCVHIGESTSGEACLRQIAEITHGQYIKFTDVSQFAKQFKYLTPQFYGQLTSGQLQIGDK